MSLILLELISLCGVSTFCFFHLICREDHCISAPKNFLIFLYHGFACVDIPNLKQSCSSHPLHPVGGNWHKHLVLEIILKCHLAWKVILHQSSPNGSFSHLTDFFFCSKPFLTSRNLWVNAIPLGKMTTKNCCKRFTPLNVYCIKSVGIWFFQLSEIIWKITSGGARCSEMLYILHFIWLQRT